MSEISGKEEATRKRQRLAASCRASASRVDVALDKECRRAYSDEDTIAALSEAATMLRLLGILLDAGGVEAVVAPVVRGPGGRFVKREVVA